MGAVVRFGTDESGAIGMIFGLALLPLVGLVGAAVDYSRAAAVQTRLQRTADATALQLVRMPATATQSQLDGQAKKLLASLLRDAPDVEVDDPKVSRNGTAITVDLAGRVKPAFMQVVGMGATAVDARARSAWGTQKIELALVLDNTGSMADGIGGGRRKIDELKDASKKLLLDLRGLATGPDTVKVSIVPFDTEVRLDPDAYRNKPWFNWLDPNDRTKWTGYTYERRGLYNLLDAAPALGVLDSLFPAPVQSEYKTVKVLKDLSTSGGALAALKPLTSLQNYSDYEGLVKTIEGMTPRGYTNVALGAVWGHSTLSPSEPFAEAAPMSDASVKKYMILLTDGDNNYHHNTLGQLSNNEAQVDANTTTACNAAKAAGIEVFTVRLVKGDETLLRNCASPPNSRITQHYFNVQSSAELSAAFEGIRDAIGGTRLTH